MKKKTVTKKLVLNKKTIVNLNKLEMNMIHGGVVATEPPTQCSCRSCGVLTLCRTIDTDDTQDTC